MSEEANAECVPGTLTDTLNCSAVLSNIPEINGTKFNYTVFAKDFLGNTNVINCEMTVKNCSCLRFDFDNDNIIDIFDAVRGLEKISNQNITLHNTKCSHTNGNEINLHDVLYLMERIIGVHQN